MGIILGIFRNLFKHNAYVYGLILLFSSYIEIFSLAWSETIFIVALVWFATSVYLFIVNPKRISLLYFSIMMASLLLFMTRYIGAFKRASEDGVKTKGYFQWSIMDNFEWQEGYKQRFGLVFVDYETCDRTLKDSAYWYSDVIKNNGEEL